MARLGTNEWWLALVYRGFQLGHRVIVRKGTSARLRQGWYARCWCGWESKTGGEGRAGTRSWGHLQDVVLAADGTLSPRISEWPTGITPTSALNDLYAVLDRRADAD